MSYRFRIDGTHYSSDVEGSVTGQTIRVAGSAVWGDLPKPWDEHPSLLEGGRYQAETVEIVAPHAEEGWATPVVVHALDAAEAAMFLVMEGSPIDVVFEFPA